MTVRSGVVLCNLGTPAEPSAKGVRQFLAPFLSDQRVVELPRLLWLPILYGIVLPLRGKRVAKAYQEIWWPEGSPLMVISQRQCSKLRERLDSSQVLVELAMSYGKPALSDAIESLRQQGVEKILVLPLYPQYSATTTASVYDQLAKYIGAQRSLPSFAISSGYHDHPAYIAALANSVVHHRQSKGAADHLLLSFHGIPKVNVRKGDPYQQQCEQTARLLAEKLELKQDQWSVAYQSRFGSQEWLQPYTPSRLQELAQSAGSVDVICPAFAADCLETLEEIEQENQTIFINAGGRDYNYIPCLNDRDDHIELLYSIVNELL